MQTDVSNVLSDLITLSDNADQIILDSNFGTDQVNQWLSLIKETASSIAKGTYCRASTSTEKPSCFSFEDLPKLVPLIKGKQNSHDVSSNLLEENRVRLSHRKSRKSLRKIVLGKSRSNQWKISNRKSSVKNMDNIPEYDDKSTTPIPKVKDRLLESASPQNKFCTPVQKKKMPSNADKTDSKQTATVEAVKVEEKSTLSSVQNSLTHLESYSKESKKVSFQFFSFEENDVTKFFTPQNATITIESDDSPDTNDYVTPLTRSKRKSSVQHSQDNAKRIKNTKSSQLRSGKQNQSKCDDNFVGNNTFKKIKLSKDVNPVIPAKNLQQQSQPQSEKRILREIQKKEEKVSQNAKKLRSMQKMKIEENKKAREKKMEKAMQQRMKIEKEKEERMRSRTQSKQENLQQTEPAPKKNGVQKKDRVAAEKRSPIKKIRVSSNKQMSLKSNKNAAEVNKIYLHEPSPKEIANTVCLNNLNATYLCSPADMENNSASSTNEKAPPKPIRSAKKPYTNSNTKVASHLESTPVAKKVESKVNVAKTPVLNNAKKPNSYVMTPHENSFVSYDISEIKSDDSDGEESSNQKPIPSWASGINLRTAILKQRYAPIDSADVFGNCFNLPILADMMGMEKKTLP